jgi:hypothetical protein
MLQLVRKPRSSVYKSKIIQAEIAAALTSKANDVKNRLLDDVKDWNDQPEFKVEVTANGDKISMATSVDETTKGGQLYKWVNDGTGERGNNGGQAYDIAPKNAGGFLGPFFVPHTIKTFPNPAVGSWPNGDNVWLKPRVVRAPGIYPRNFVKNVLDELRGTGIGTFRNIIDAAIKRGIRRS